MVQNFSWDRQPEVNIPTHYPFEDEPTVWGIKYKCPGCKKEIKFPSCPNFETSRPEQIAHMIYTACRNEHNGAGRLCWECEGKIKRGEMADPFEDEETTEEEDE